MDNTNPSQAEWQPLIQIARLAGARVVAYWFPPNPDSSARRNASRTGRARVPEAGLRATMTRLQEPGLQDGFDAVMTVSLDGAGGFAVRTAYDGGTG